MAPGLITKEILRFKTEIGVCNIELCVGDITKLPAEQKVDVLVVSAFPGDYSPTPSSLIGQLKIQLGLSVKDLSKNKEEDLRKQYYCWWSRPLREDLSFGRVLCFEGGFGSAGTKPPAVIGAVFRCLIPVLNNKEGSVIMPLLASGDQGYSKRLVLRQVMKAAVNWMRAGLPLRTLKIVIFARYPEKQDKSHEPLYELFQEFKDKYDDKNIDEEATEGDVILKDVYLSHCKEDHSTAAEVREFLETKGDVSVFNDVQELNEDESWQEEIYNVMVRCARVITLLSPGYLSSVSCIEQYNMAMCISRRTHKEVLAPLYITSVPSLPTYMGLMQYIDCRPRDKEKLDKATSSITEWLANMKSRPSPSTPSTKQSTVYELYDVFISYSHCNNDQAMELLQQIKAHNPAVKVFIDTSGLNTGASWQQTLYHALDSSKCMVALLSPDYVKSKVCKEEFSLALALHLDAARHFRLVNMLVEPVEELPVWCHKPVPIDCSSREGDVTAWLSRVARSVGKTSIEEPDDELESRLAALKERHTSIDDFTQKYRQIQFVHRKQLLDRPMPFNATQSDRSGHAHHVAFAADSHHQSAVSGKEVAGAMECDVALSYASEDAAAAVIIKQLLLERYPTLKLSEPKTNATSRLAALDVARVIVLLLSPVFLSSKELMEELNIALYRNRSTEEHIVYTIQISALPLHPTYVHLIPCDFAANDYGWKIRASEDQVCPGRIEQFARENDVGEGVASCLIDASDVIAAQLTNGTSEGNHCQVLLNAFEVLQTWNELRENFRNEDGLDAVKRALFGIEILNEPQIKIADKKESKEGATQTESPSLKGEVLLERNEDANTSKAIHEDDRNAAALAAKETSPDYNDGGKSHDGSGNSRDGSDKLRDGSDNPPDGSVNPHDGINKPHDGSEKPRDGSDQSRGDETGGESVLSRTRTVSFSPDVEVAEQSSDEDKRREISSRRSSACLLI